MDFQSKNVPLYLCYLDDKNEIKVRVCKKSEDLKKLAEARQYPETSSLYKAFFVDDSSLDGSSGS